ncbi:YciI family protein [Tessaracoccus lubricantis]|uniref:YciI family protein n=1 Tax=Tessaracoccus lubricantis TaxID=545543 RepID=A0ABP9FCG0_9ACTN
MAHFLLSVIHAGDPFPEGADIQDIFETVGRLNKEMMDAGVWVYAGGLTPPSEARYVTEEGVVVEGPVLDYPDQINGFWILDVDDDAAALEWAKRAVATGCNRTVEVRPFQND